MLTKSEERSMWLRKLHSLTGVLPIGLFLIEHFYTNSYATWGPEKYNEKIEFFQGLNYLIFIELFGIILPILFHGVYGLVVTYSASPNTHRYSNVRNWMYTLQRVTGIILFFYIFFHVYTTRVQPFLRPGTVVTFDTVAHAVDNPLVFAFYVAGILSATFHFANGLWSFLITWGVTVGEKGQRVSAFVCAAIFVVMSIVGIQSLLAFVGIGVRNV